MSVRLNLSFNYVSFFKESIFLSFTTKHKKIIAIVGLALSCLAVCYTMIRLNYFRVKKLENLKIEQQGSKNGSSDKVESLGAKSKNDHFLDSNKSLNFSFQSPKSKELTGEDVSSSISREHFGGCSPILSCNNHSPHSPNQLEIDSGFDDDDGEFGLSQ